MTTEWIGRFALWLADLFFVSSLLLVTALAAFAVLRQPARRMTVARATALGLTGLVILTTVPGWPRHSWRINWLPQQEATIATYSPRFTAQIPGGHAAMPDRNQPPEALALNTAANSAQVVSLPEKSNQERAGVEPVAVPASVPASSSHDDRKWISQIIAAYITGFLLSAAWLVLGAVQAALVCRRSHAANERLRTVLRACLSEGHRAPCLRLSEQIAQPVAIGILRPTILLPEPFVVHEPEERIRTALAHELAHIGNGDLWLLATCRCLLPLYYAHPLFWLLRRQIRLDQEVLADVAAAKADRTRYAETLLGWARSMTARPAGSNIAALGLWERPSQLRRRIALLLDERFAIEPCSPRRWRLAAWGMGTALVMGLSLGSIRPPASDDRIEPSRASTEPASTEGGAIVFQGQVVDPNGKPFAGARVFLHYFKDTMARTPLEPRATTGADGRFRFTVEKSHYDRAAFEPWKYTPVVAVAAGFGLGVSDSEEPDANRDVTVRLAHDDVPIRGRLIDLQGRPVASARIRVERVATSAKGDLTPFLTAAKESKFRIYELRDRYLSRDFQFTDSFHPIPTVTADSDGRFVVRGIGREREVSLMVEGSSVRWTEVSALTRPGPAIKIVDLWRAKDPWIETYHGAEFTLTLPPSRPYVGFVRDRDTGRGVPGVSIESYRLADNPISNNRQVKARTDEDGHFRLEGMPIGAGNEVVLMPPEDEPYLASHQKLRIRTRAEPDRRGLRPQAWCLGAGQGHQQVRRQARAGALAVCRRGR